MLDKYLYKYIGKAKAYISRSVLLMMTKTFGTFFLALAFGILISNLYYSREIEIFKLSLLFILGLAIRIFAVYKVNNYNAKIVGEVKGELRKSLIEKATSIGLGYKENTSTSNLINMGSDTIEQLENYYGRFLPEYYGCYGVSLVNLIIFFLIDWHIGLLFLVLMPIIPLFLKGLLKFVTSMQGSYWKKYQDVGALFLDSLQGITALKIFGADKKRAREINDKSEDFRIMTMKILTMQLSSITLIEWIAYGSSVGCIFMSLYAFSKEGVSLESLIIVLILAMEAFNPMITLTASFHVAMTGVAAGKNLIEFLNLEEDRRVESFPEGELESLEVKDLSFAYKGNDENSLIDINLNLPQKGSVGLVGESGCGKSTLTKVLAGSIRASEGDVYANGKAYGEIRSNYIGQNIFRISHDSHIFEESVYENLTMGDKSISDKEIEEALKKVNLYGEIMDRGGVDARLTSGGNNLSGGQRQRLSLARAILHDPKAYIFDEATSNIDIESEEIIFKNIREISRDKLVIIVSHRLSSIKDADKIYVMDKGRIIEEGDHESLMDLNGDYKRIYDGQKILEGAL